jgi:hypothetical protein
VYPFERTSRGSNFDLVNPVSWQRVDERIKYAVGKGLMMYLMTSSDGGHFAWPEAQRERLYKYIVARYAAYNVGFGGGEEVDRAGVGSDAKYIHMINTLHNLDPYRKMVGMHATATGVQLVPKAVDFSLLQYYLGITIKYSEAGDVSRKLQKPFVLAETWYFEYDKPGMSDPATIRAIAWRTYLGGAAGYTYGHTGITIANRRVDYSGQYNMADLKDTSAKEMRKVAAWMQQDGLEWWSFSSFTSLGNGRYLTARPGKQYVLYNETNSGSYKANLSSAAGTLTGRWYNIVTGAYGATVSIEPSSQATINPPGPWHVLRLDVAGSTPAPKPSASLSASPTSISSGQSATL